MNDIKISNKLSSTNSIDFNQSSSNASLDAFKRLRVSNPFPVFTSKNIYDMNPLFFDNILVGGGTATFSQPRASIDLTVGTASGDKVTRRSRQWVKYQAGSSQLIKMTGVFSTGKTNVSQRLGYFDDLNGLALEVTGTTINLLRRTSTSGSVVNNLTPQSGWNLDKLDGTGSSGVVMDFTKGLILVIDFEWLSLGRVRWGFDLGNKIIYCHEFIAVNNLIVPYMSTPDLPITWEIENTGVSASATTMTAICCSVHSEGGEEPKGIKFSRPNPTAKSVTIAALEIPALSIRLKSTFGGVVNRGIVVSLGSWCTNTVTNSDILVRVYKNTTLTGASWVSQSANSIVEYDITATAVNIATAELVDSYQITGVGNVEMPIDDVLPLTLNSLGTISDILTITVQAMTGSATGVITCGCDWKEWR